MTDDRKSNSLAPSRTKMKLDAYTDWFIVAAATLLTALDKMPYELTAGIFGGIAGLAVYARKMGKGATATGLVLLLSKKILVGIGIGAILFGCGTGITAGQAIKTLLPVAADALRDIAAREGVKIDEAGAVCFEAPEIEIEEIEGVGVVALVCFAPYVE